MEKACWNGKIIFASDIYQIFENEQQIRDASSSKQLYCIDPDCKEPIQYNHGNIRIPYFSHIRKNCTCDYYSYANENEGAINTIKNKLFQSLTQKGFSVEEGIKILPHHYTHLLVTLNNEKIAIEIGNKHTSYNKTENLTKQYQELKIKVIWIAIDNRLAIKNEKYYGHIKRFIINTSPNKDLIVTSEDGSKVIQSKEDFCEYKIPPTKSENGKIFFQEGTIDDLTFEETELTLPNFISNYEKWLSEKQAAYKKSLEILEKRKKSVPTYTPPIKSEYTFTTNIKNENPFSISFANHAITPRVHMLILHPDLGPVRILEVTEDDQHTFILIEDNSGNRYRSFWDELRQNPKLKILYNPYT